MTAVSKDGQAGLFDKILEHPELLDAVEECLETREVASQHTRAKARIKALTPAVEENTRFLLGDGYFVEARPRTVEARTVEFEAKEGQRNTPGRVEQEG